MPNSSCDNNTDKYCLDRGDSIGLTLTTESGFISLVAVLVVFGFVARKLVLGIRLVQNPVDIYMLSLFTFDLIQAMGTVLDVKWVNEGIVYTGGYCTAQGTIQQLGETGVAIATLTIAIHTFIVVMWKKLTNNLKVAYIVVALTWLFDILLVSISVALNTNPSKGQFEMGPATYWCWIEKDHKAERIGGEYFWFWLTLFSSVILYVPLFFWARGNLNMSQKKWWKVQIHKRVKREDDLDAGRTRRSLSMIAYPVIYSIVVIPLSAVRFKTNFGEDNNLPSVATFVVIFIYSLSGFFNALLFMLTRADLLFTNSPDLKREVGVAPGAGSEVMIGVEHVGSEEELGGEKLGSRMTTGIRREDSNHLAPSIALGSGSSDGGWEPPVIDDDDSKGILTVPR